MQLSVHNQPEKYLENDLWGFMRLPKEEDRVGHFEVAYGKQEEDYEQSKYYGNRY